jgi:hypothetical protein
MIGGDNKNERIRNDRGKKYSEGDEKVHIQINLL